ncbi:uncharacterized protein LOC118660633 [Myotis myotis]|uniref:uncharacterized protein LOC118660633 n=1 Tax=Myotis myotis TaxID=51298 RepID=UPI00174BC2D7|nr:uncharacterized protein LOC118660633 [Myotis myotis]
MSRKEQQAPVAEGACVLRAGLCCENPRAHPEALLVPRQWRPRCTRGHLQSQAFATLFSSQTFLTSWSPAGGCWVAAAPPHAECRDHGSSRPREAEGNAWVKQEPSLQNRPRPAHRMKAVLPPALHPHAVRSCGGCRIAELTGDFFLRLTRFTRHTLRPPRCAEVGFRPRRDSCRGCVPGGGWRLKLRLQHRDHFSRAVPRASEEGLCPGLAPADGGAGPALHLQTSGEKGEVPACTAQ